MSYVRAASVELKGVARVQPANRFLHRVWAPLAACNDLAREDAEACFESSVESGAAPLEASAVQGRQLQGRTSQGNVNQGNTHQGAQIQFGNGKSQQAESEAGARRERDSWLRTLNGAHLRAANEAIVLKRGRLVDPRGEAFRGPVAAIGPDGEMVSFDVEALMAADGQLRYLVRREGRDVCLPHESGVALVVSEVHERQVRLEAEHHLSAGFVARAAHEAVLPDHVGVA